MTIFNQSTPQQQPKYINRDCNRLRSLSDHFSKWHQVCISQSLQVGPVNRQLVTLWSDIHKLHLDCGTIDDIVRVNQ